MPLMLWVVMVLAAAPPTDAQCQGVPAMRAPFAFAPGETLEYALDALGAQAGKLTLQVLPEKGGTLPIEVRAQTNTFFSKIRRVNGTATSYLQTNSLHPSRYEEDTLENEVHKTASVVFRRDHGVQLDFTLGDKTGHKDFRPPHDALDVAGGMHLIRQLPLRVGLALCFDVYGIRTLWRVTGKVEGREHLSLPVGEFEAWHVSGIAVRLDDIRQQREIHAWISDDARRLPLVAVGTIDLGAVRATLTAFGRPGSRGARAENKANLKW